MIHSMTAFVSNVFRHENGLLTWELRSSNHRYLELSIRLPETLRSLEPIVRDKLRQCLQRGKIEGILKYQPSPTGINSCQVNTAWVQQLASATQQIQQVWPSLLPANVMEILNWPHVLQASEESEASVQKAVLETFEQTLQIFLAKRQAEGAALRTYLQERLKDFLQKFTVIKNRLPKLMNDQRKKMHHRFAELQHEVDEERFAQEVALLLQKVDVAEELARIEIHTQEIHNTLQGMGTLGKRLDFLLQELNRETNTFSAKSFDAKVTLAVIELKILIEQMREQVQNVE
jgi:uncharacterized protein (TIGR00255 family)